MFRGLKGFQDSGCNPYLSPTNPLPISYQSPTNLLPISYQSPTNPLPISYQSHTNLIPISYQSHTNLLPIPTNLIPISYIFTYRSLIVSYYLQGTYDTNGYAPTRRRRTQIHQATKADIQETPHAEGVHRYIKPQRRIFRRPHTPKAYTDTTSHKGGYSGDPTRRRRTQIHQATKADIQETPHAEGVHRYIKPQRRNT